MDNNGAKDDVAELEGREFKIVKKGLDKAQVAAFINELVRQRDELLSERNMLIQREKHMLSLTKLAERTVIEADKLTEEIKKEAIAQAKTETDKLTEEIKKEAIKQAKIEAKIEADKLTEEIKKEAIEQTKTEAATIMAKAKERSQEQTHRVYDQLLSQLENLKQQVVALEKELSQTTDKIKVTATEKQLPSTRVPAAPEISLESADKRDTKPQELIQIIDLTKRTTSQEKASVLADNQEPTTYEKEVELEILPPVNPMKIMEIMKYLDNLPEVLDIELIPRADKPSIIVSQRESIPLANMLRKLPQVGHVKEATDGEVAVTCTDSADGGKRRKIEITLSSAV